MTTVTTADSYRAAFNEIASTLPGFPEPRRAALQAFESLGFPTERNEDWKFTSLAPFLRKPHHLAPSKASASAHAFTLSEALDNLPGDVNPHLGRIADATSLPFVALNTAFWDDGLFIDVPNGVTIDEPILLSFTGNGDGSSLTCQRVLVVLGQGARATIWERHEGGAGTSNTVCEFVLGEGAALDHYKSQEELVTANHFATSSIVLHSNAVFTSHYFGLGGALVRNEVRVRFAGERAEATVNGLYQIDGTQHHDNHTVIDHALPNCASHELYKGILGGKSRGVFNGKIFVRADAQKTDAKQTNKTLLLSDEATINTKPQLEIYADDVKCTHGATVGQLDANQLFYLKSRGIPESQARALLTFAFANDLVSRVKIPALRSQLERHLLHSHHLPALAAEDIR